MGKRQHKKKRQNRHIQQRVGPSKPAVASPSTMTPVPLSSGGISADDSTSVPLLPNDDGTGCAHLKSGVNLEKLRTHFSTKPLQQCHECTRRTSRLQDKKGRAFKVAAKKDMWICLACGHIGCGSHTSEGKDGNQNVSCLTGGSHAKTHPTAQSQHFIVMKWGESLDCWCLKCKLQLKYSGISTGDSGVSNGVDVATEGSTVASNPKLLQSAATVVQESISGQSSISKVDHVESGQVIEVEEDSKPSSRHAVEAVSSLGSRRVMRGLMNLGNTCFFNSVMQNLVGVSMLREHFSKEVSTQEGVLKTALRKFFQEMDPTEGADDSKTAPLTTMKTRFGGSVGNAVSPRGLFSAICTKAPRFKGFQQQDSHELLRCLLDGLHMEEESIRKAQLAQSDVGSAAELNGTVEEEGSPKKVIKVPDTFVEHMFGGQLSSTVSCCECGHSSVVYEPFLDLSVPIPSKQSMGKVDKDLSLPKLIAQRSQRGDLSGNGVLSIKTAGCSLLNSGLVDNKPTALEDTKKSEKSPVLGCSLEGSVLDGGAVNSETPDEHDSTSGEQKPGSTTGDKDHVAQGVDSPATSFPCEIVSEGVTSSSGAGKTDGWTDFLDEPMEGISGESAGIDSDTLATVSGAPDANQSRDVDSDSRGESSTKRGEGVVNNSSGEMFSTQEGAASQAEEVGNEPLENGNHMEEVTPVYGPHLPEAEDRTEYKQECRDIVLFQLPSLPGCPGTSNLPSEMKDQTNETSAGDKSSRETTSASAKPQSRGSEEDLDGMAGLFVEDESSSSSVNNVDSIGAVPAFSSDRAELNLDQISGSRSGSARGVREVETYPIMSLEGCLQAFTKTEVLSGENAWGCENCTRIAHGYREPDQSGELEEEKNTNCSKQLPETEGHSSEIEPTSVEGDAMQGDWEALSLEDRVTSGDESVEMLDQQNNGSTIESSTNEMVTQSNDEQNAVEASAGKAEANSAEPSTVEDASSSKCDIVPCRNTLKRSQSQDCHDESAGLRSVKEADSHPSSSPKRKDAIEEHYVLVEGPSASTDGVEDDTASSNGRVLRSSSSKKTHSSDVVMKDKTGKLSAKAKEANGAKKLEKEAPKMVTVKRDATKRFLISKAPLVLTVHLKRFAQDMHGRLSKLSGHITFHEQLDLGSFIDQRDGVKRDGVYQLIGTVEHSGTMRGGHYVAYVKGSHINGENDAEDSSEGASTWYYISDSHVRKTSLESVLQSEAYLLFYERQTFE